MTCTVCTYVALWDCSEVFNYVLLKPSGHHCACGYLYPSQHACTLIYCRTCLNDTENQSSRGFQLLKCMPGRNVDEHSDMLCRVLCRSSNASFFVTYHIQYASKKPVRTCAKSIVAAVHINSRITLRTSMHVDRMVLCTQRTKSNQSLVRSTAIVEAWVY